MSSVVLILGTDHRYQRHDTAFSEVQHDAFVKFVTQVCHTYHIHAIAEENNKQALTEAGLEESVPQHIARMLGLIHRHCDPDRTTRMKLGIVQENDLRAQAFFKDWPDTVVQEKLEASHRVRERYWLQQLIALDVWPALFVCGADHSQELLSLMLESGVQAELIAKDWPLAHIED